MIIATYQANVFLYQDGKHVLFTALHDYKLKLDQSAPHAVLTVFDELFLKKGTSLYQIVDLHKLKWDD